jgi:AraC family transcriptional regulator, transcriptional activator of pobA
MKNIASSKVNELDKLYIKAGTNMPARFINQKKRNEPRHFSVFYRNEQACNENIHANRSDFFKILLMTKGDGEFDYGSECYLVKAPCLIFVRPQEVKACRETTTGQDGYYCVFTQDFYATGSALLKEIKQFPFFAPGAHPVVPLNEVQKTTMLEIFKKLHTEFNAEEDYNEAIIHSYLRILFMESLRIRGWQSPADPLSARFILTQKFSNLLEEQFSTAGADERRLTRTPAQFAEILHVHPNHLNAVVKQTTGKTIRELINERTLSEAKILLKHTDKQASEIAYELGFLEAASFNRFFKKLTGITPLLFRNQTL